MKHAAAPTALAIKIVTGAVAGLAGLFLVLWIKLPAFALVGLLLFLVLLGCYLRAPVAYEYSSGALNVLFRLGSRHFSTVTHASAVPQKLPWTIRAWGNGGVFAATGIYWNRLWGYFRMYATTSDRAYLVLVETTSQKVVISPANPTAFIDDVTAGI